jgi:diguanylate cyclase (GGDEF)-like protein/PAS domain S-box-containing protein
MDFGNLMLKQETSSEPIFTEKLNAAEEDKLTPPELRPKIAEQQIIGLFLVMKYSSIGTLIFSALTFAALYKSVNLTALSIWAVLVNIFAIYRYFLARTFEWRRQHKTVNIQRWIKYAFIIILIQGLAWASLPLAISTHVPPGSAAFVVYLLCSLSFGGFTTLGFYLPIYAASAIPIFLATAYWFFYLTPTDFIPIAAMIAMASLTMINSARNTQTVWRRTIRLVYEQEALAIKLGEEKERALTTLKSIGDAVITTDLNGKILFLNPSAEALSGWTNDLVHDCMLDQVLHLVEESTRNHITVSISPNLTEPLVLKQNIIFLNKFGKDVASVEVVLSPVVVPPNRTTGFVVAIHDVTELRQIAKDMTDKAAHDPLTGLLNRRSFEMQLEHILDPQHNEPKLHALCYLDLDNFKVINDTCGHAAGDELLKQIANILRKQVREMDSVSRIGGDEFAIILRGCDMTRAELIAEDICTKIKSIHFKWNQKEYPVGVSIGVTNIMPDDSAKNIIEAADSACYASKRDGRGMVHLADQRVKSGS